MVPWRLLFVHLSVHLRRSRAILHDPEIYPDPEEFKPERFLDEDGSVRDDPTLSLVFGIGKRICPGRHFVDATIFIVASSVLSVFNVTKAKDENGYEIPVKVAVSTERKIVMWVRILAHYCLKLRVRFSRHPGEFECSILPRDKVAEGLISANTLPWGIIYFFWNITTSTPASPGPGRLLIRRYTPDPPEMQISRKIF